MIESLLQDSRYTFRTLCKDPGFAAIAILILALGIGANIVVFSVVDTLLLRPLPFPHSEQLVWFAGNHGVGGLSGTTYNVGSFEEYARHAQSFQEVTAYQCFWGSSEFNMTGHGDPQHISSRYGRQQFLSHTRRYARSRPHFSSRRTQKRRRARRHAHLSLLAAAIRR